ncbi:CaiB/BaiF CoA transferase family protein [Cupriavidus basilensis]
MHAPDNDAKRGPLAGIRIIELAGIGPGPLAGMLLADMGAEVLRIERPGDTDLGVKRERRFDLMLRNRESIALDLKDPQGVATVLELVEKGRCADRGLPPRRHRAHGPGTGRLHGAQSAPGVRPHHRLGPAWTAGTHSGPRHQLHRSHRCAQCHRPARRPSRDPPAYLGDFAGGGMFLVAGVLAALIEAGRSGKGQVVDAAIVDGAAALGAVFFGMTAAGQWRQVRGTNVLDSGAHYYNVYQCKDGGWISVGPIEARFYRDLLARIGVDPASLGDQAEPRDWDAASAALAEVFRTRTRDEWCALLEGTDACFAPVLSYQEAPRHPHLQARGTFVEVDGIMHPGPAPRFSRTPSVPPAAPREPDVRDIGRVLAGWLPPDRIDAARAASETACARN